jgi:hypothetical protein
MNKSHLFWWGCFGAVVPELIRFLKLAASGQPLPHLNWPLYVGLLLLFVLAAGAFAVAWKAENEFKAIWVGASFPTIVATLIQVAPAIPKS